jgi:heme/copper-type cytochrome/quinol oxidase subunit 2
MDEQYDPALTLKVIGRQWYWSYEYTDKIELSIPLFGDEDDDIYLLEDLTFDAYLDQDFEEMSTYRLLKTDNDIYLPTHSYIRVLVTSSDVIHSWAVPALGVKVDACPGRLNQIMVYIQRAGQFFGQCSELCGLNHAFMPISVLAVPFEVFLDWRIGHDEHFSDVEISQADDELTMFANSLLGSDDFTAAGDGWSEYNFTKSADGEFIMSNDPEVLRKLND